MPPNVVATGPEAPAPAAERTPAQPSAVARGQEATRSGMGRVFDNGLGNRFSNGLNTITTPLDEGWKPLQKPPSLSTIGKVATVGALAAFPMVTAPVAGGAYVGYKTWNKLAQYRPFSWVDRGVRKGVNTAKDLGYEGVSSVASVAAYPFKVVGRIGANIYRIGTRVAAKTLDATVVELIRDVEEGINHKFNFPKGTNLIAQAILAGKAMGHALISIPGGYLSAVAKHPVGVPLATLGITGLLANAGWNPIEAGRLLAGGVGDLFKLVMQVLQKQVGP